MRRIMLAVPAIVLSMTLVALAQKAPENPVTKSDDKAATDKSKVLEELLAKALQNSPDVQVAEARLKEAEAALRQARMSVAQKTVELQQSMDQKLNLLRLVESRYKQAANLREKGSIPESELNQVATELANQKSQLAQLEVQVNMLVGRLPVVATLERANGGDELFTRVDGHNLGGGGGSGGTGEPQVRRLPQANTATKLRALLGSNVKVDHAGAVPLPDLINYVRSATNAPILTTGIPEQESFRIDFKGEVTLAAYFQILADTVPDLNVFVRDYGFLITTATPPADAVHVMEFLRGEEKKK